VRETARAVVGGGYEPSVLVVSEDITESRRRSEQLAYHANHDDLTGLVNRRAFEERLERALIVARAEKVEHALCYLDLDQFKAINDSHGHPAGDTALRSFTRILERNVRASDAVGRVGGDEFALIIVGADSNDVASILERIASTLETDPPAPGELRASYGVARAPDDGWTREELIEAADRRLYDHKRRRHIRILPTAASSDP
jgi:diguanylate cyclase (GGDEF)-like protein